MKNLIIATIAVTALAFATTKSANAGPRVRRNVGRSQVSFGGNGWNISIGGRRSRSGYGYRSNYRNSYRNGYRNSRNNLHVRPVYQPAHYDYQSTRNNYQPTHSNYRSNRSNYNLH